MTEKKVTKVEMFERIKAQLVNEEDIAFIDKQIELTKKKNASKSKVDKNVDLRNAILDVFFDSNEILSQMAWEGIFKAGKKCLPNYSTQMVTHSICVCSDCVCIHKHAHTQC